MTSPNFRRNPGQARARSELLTQGFRYCLIYGGSRSGKTFEIVGTILERALYAPGSRHLVIRQEAASAKRAVVKGTIPEVIKIRWPGLDAKWNELYGFFKLPNGSEIWVGGLNDAKAMEKILGNEYATIYINEASEVAYEGFTLLRTRLAQTVKTIDDGQLSQRFYVDLNPTVRQHWTYRAWVDKVEPIEQTPHADPTQWGSITLNPMDNAANLSQEYLQDLRNLPNRARKRFYEGQYGQDAEGALWHRDMFQRVAELPTLVRTVVAIDPAVTAKMGSDETGIMIGGIDRHGFGYLIDDISGRHEPSQWAKKVIAAYDLYQCDRIVAEANQGGDLVESTIRAIRPDISYRPVRATRGKMLRAEPIAALYERGKIYHYCPNSPAEFDELENQLCSFTVGFDRKAAGYSPDRLDALVWLFSSLFDSLVVNPYDGEEDDDDDWSNDQGVSDVTGY